MTGKNEGRNTEKVKMIGQIHKSSIGDILSKSRDYFTIIENGDGKMKEIQILGKIGNGEGDLKLEEKKLSFKTRLSYSFGDLACNILFAATANMASYFYTNIVGMSAAVVGTILCFPECLMDSAMQLWE